MNAECTTRRCGERTLVEVTLTSDRPRCVRVEPTEQSFSPPRTDGVLDPGWDGEGYTDVVDGHLGVGFAVAASVDTDDPPVGVEWRGPPDDDSTFERHPDVPNVAATPDGVLRDLSDPRPPGDAVPARASTPDSSTAEVETAPEGEYWNGSTTTGVSERPSVADRDHSTEQDGEATSDAAERVDEPDRDDEPPTPTIASLDTLERRLELAERLDDVETLDEASAAVADTGGLDGVRALDDALVADRDRLRVLAERIETLRQRTEQVDVPTETLARIAGEQS